jgi:bifunctional non-homologous end joining protein LigD
MALQEYKKKRSFTATPEPKGGKPKGKKLEFVVQKHAATQLHYDFRLELKGVLKSWAIPKGPSMDPSVKHLAMQVEDHPYDYKDFEGTIPQGQYGGGTVIIWDRGTYEPLEKSKSKAGQEKIMLKEFQSGSIKIRLKGKKLKGEFALVHTRGRGENSWLIIKHRDQYATTADITAQNKSLVSKKTIEQMSKDKNAKQWISNNAENTSSLGKKTNQPKHSGLRKLDQEQKKVLSKSSKKKTTVGSLGKNTAQDQGESLKGSDLQKLIKTGVKHAMDSQIAPMLCTLTKEPIDDPAFIHEIKWDGFRIISYVKKGKIRMDSRSAKDYTQRYPLIVQALKDLEKDAVIDGEVVVFNQEGMPDFDALQLYNGHNSEISYCVFDLLWMDGYNLMGLTLENRKSLLKDLIKNDSVFKFSDSFDDGPGLYTEMLKRNLEGIVSKRKDSCYTPGARANDWLKTPTRKRQEFVIGGWAESNKSRAFKSLLFGAYNKGKLEWIGRSGGGYKENEMPAILKSLKGLETKTSPFLNPVLDTKGALTHWVKPKLVANFEFATWTKTGRIRKPAIFLGFRKDKKPKQVIREVPKAVKEVEAEMVQDESAEPALSHPVKKTGK